MSRKYQPVHISFKFKTSSQNVFTLYIAVLNLTLNYHNEL